MTTAPMPRPYKMTVSLNVLNHLGINLYSNIPAVLSELVANAYDADAESVSIDIDDENDVIIVTDTGVGMTAAEVNSRFLHVGYDKRHDATNRLATVTPKGRKPMGRKGIGKLSVFSIARSVEVHTAKDGQRSGFVMTLEDIQATIGSVEGDSTYYPQPIPEEEVLVESGTMLVLKDLKKQANKTAAHLRRRLARRFSLLEEAEAPFHIVIDGDRIGIEDRDYFKKVQFMWYLGTDSSWAADAAENATSRVVLDDVVNPGVPVAEQFRVRGWVGTVDKPNDLEENDNVIVMLARGKLIQEDVLSQFQEAGVYANYIVGEIHADFLDSDDQEDIVTSDRQRIKEDDPRYGLLKDFLLENVIRRISRDWTRLRLEEGRKRIETNPVLKRWIDMHKGDTRKYAEQMLAKIETFKFSDDESKAELFRASIMGFERLALKHALSRLDQVGEQESFTAAMAVLAEVDDLEAAHYYEIVKARLDVIKTFKAQLPTDRERVVQQYLFDHLWLLDPSWERATDVPPILEEAVKTSFAGVDGRLTAEERDGRVDIRYQKVGGEHVIIELKKFDRRVTMFELAAQVNKYRTALAKLLNAQFHVVNPVIRSICLVGSMPEDYDDQTSASLASINAQVVPYGSMIASAEAAYLEFLGRDQKVGSITQLVEEIAASIRGGTAPPNHDPIP